MSLFLGKIHYLQYNKVQLNEDILEEILKLAEEKGVPVEALKHEIYEKYGYPERRELEQVIDQSNIHEWLQSKIESVEDRTAAIVTKLISDYNVKIDEIADIYFNSGKKVMKNIGEDDFLPSDIFNLIYEYMLEGMPCDMVNKPISNSKDEFLWETTKCIHTKNWDRAGGDINNFYKLRDAWINGLLEDTDYCYIRDEYGINKIIRNNGQNTKTNLK